MHLYVLKRLLAIVPILIGLTIIVFAIMALIPGDPATAIASLWEIAPAIGREGSPVAAHALGILATLPEDPERADERERLRSRFEALAEPPS